MLPHPMKARRMGEGEVAMEGSQACREPAAIQANPDALNAAAVGREIPQTA
jgi:hypothetical protein